jgi:tripeptidyl-peptidase-1
MLLHVVSALQIQMRTIYDDYIVASASTGHWERMLQTEFHYFNGERGGMRESDVIRADKYFLPADIQPHVSGVFGTVQNPFVLSSATKYSAARGLSTLPMAAAASGPVVYSGYSTVDWIRSLYGVPSDVAGDTNIANYTQCVYEQGTQRYSVDDLNMFQEMFDLPIQRPTDVNNVSVSSAQCANDTAIDCAEANLDLQYIMGIARNTSTCYWYMHGRYTSVMVDYVIEVANTPNPPLVHSISWGGNEYYMSSSEMDAFNEAALKLSAVGVTIVSSSGDAGVTSSSSSCHVYSGSAGASWTGSNSWSGRGYLPSFPATSPYVTAVGTHITI